MPVLLALFPVFAVIEQVRRYEQDRACDDEFHCWVPASKVLCSPMLDELIYFLIANKTTLQTNWLAGAWGEVEAVALS